MKKSIVINNNTVFYEDNGNSNKMVLLFVHGNGSCMDAWHGVVDSGILKQYRLIIPDLPGHGSSSGFADTDSESNAFAYCGDILLGLLVALDIRSNVILIGHSMGSNVILQSMHKFFQVCGLILMNTAPMQSIAEIGEAYSITEQIAVLFNENILDEEITMFARSMVAEKKTIHIEYIRQWIRNSDKNVRVGFARALPELKNEWAILNALPYPVVLIESDLDVVINVEYIRTKLPKENLWNKNINMLTGYGHYLPIEAPEAVATIIESYVKFRIHAIS